jgi:hypothetical protein
MVSVSYIFYISSIDVFVLCQMSLSESVFHRCLLLVDGDNVLVKCIVEGLSYKEEYETFKTKIDRIDSYVL